MVQTETKERAANLEKSKVHNLKLINDFHQGEEGIDHAFSDKIDARLADAKKIKKDIRREINEMKIKDPLTAEYYDKKFLQRNEIDEQFEDDISPEKLLSVIKYYPGSAKGPNPEDDPEHYSDWFMRNQPVDELYPDDVGKNTSFEDIGVKYKFVWNKKEIDDEAMNIEYKDNVMNYLEREELYNMQTYTGVPEFDIFDSSKFDK